MTKTPSLSLCLALLLAPLAAPGAAAEAPAWVARSDENARVLLDVMARFTPERAAGFGMSGLDEQILDLEPGREERLRAALESVLSTLEARRAQEPAGPVRQDLDILVESARRQLEGNALNERLVVPYVDAPQVVFQGLRGLLDDQVAPDRRKAALVRFRRYVGLEAGRTPLLELAAARTRAGLANTSLQPPVKVEVEKNLGNSAVYVDGIAKLFQKYGLAGSEEAQARFKAQVDAYNAFLRSEVLPKSRADFREPPELYAFELRRYGVDIPAAELAQRARISFMEIRNEMKVIGGLVAAEKKLPAPDYRDVIRALKKQQIVGDAILAHYQARLAQVEEIIRREKIVTLPERKARIRLASEAESAQQPAPSMRAPRLIGNTGEQGEFILPLRVPTAGKVMDYDDFTYEAASWTLIAHEARPGHELQFSAMVEKGISTARAVFAFNSVNVEGWGLYAEAEMKPYLPLEGQLCGLQFRLQRAARSFLDPMVNLGLMTPEQVKDFLMKEVVLSEGMAQQEVDRYTYRAPGQATSYFYGYQRLMETRQRAEIALREKFNRKAFNDFVLSQGLLPPSLLEKAVMEDFVKKS